VRNISESADDLSQDHEYKQYTNWGIKDNARQGRRPDPQ